MIAQTTAGEMRVYGYKVTLARNGFYIVARVIERDVRIAVGDYREIRTVKISPAVARFADRAEAERLAGELAEMDDVEVLS